MTQELKPCPFCGAEAEYAVNTFGVEHVQCSQCHTVIRISKGDVSRWNTRANLAFEKRARVVCGVKACPLCGSFHVYLDFQQRLIHCPDCGVNHGLGYLHDGANQEIVDSWNKRA